MGDCLHCSDLIGKVGKGTDRRVNDYNTPYGTQNLEHRLWECPSDSTALQLEKVILDILEMRGWLLPHKNSGRRAEVVAFKFKAKTSSKMIQEYESNMKWIETLITYHHSNIDSPSWPQTVSMVDRAHTLISKDSIDPSKKSMLESILAPMGGRYLESNLSIMMQRSIRLKAKDGVLALEERHDICSIM